MPKRVLLRLEKLSLCYQCTIFHYDLLNLWGASLFTPVFSPSFSIGGTLPIVFAYFSEFLSREKRGEHLSWLCMFWMIGGLYASIMAWSIIPHYGEHFRIQVAPVLKPISVQNLVLNCLTQVLYSNCINVHGIGGETQEQVIFLCHMHLQNVCTNALFDHISLCWQS